MRSSRRSSWPYASVGLVATLLCVGAPVTLLCQSTTGTLTGTVSDETGAVIPDLSVGLSGEYVVGTLHALTDEQGRYRFTTLPPGSYDASFAWLGFVEVKHHGLKVRLGGAHELNVTLRRKGVTEEVTVRADNRALDVTSSRVGANYDEDWVRNAPGRRVTFFDLINAAPGVSADSTTSGRSTSLGSNSDENAYLLDGTDFTAPATGTAWPWPNVDAIGEIEVVTLGAPAEYGNVQGAVFNVVTRQGSNQFHGDANFYFQNQGLTGRNTSDDQDGGFPYHRDAYRDLTLQLGGPIRKDRLWFFASYQYQRDRASRSGRDPRYPELFQEDRVFFKLSGQIDARTRLMVAYHDDFYRLSEPALPNIAPSAISVGHGHDPTPNLTFTRSLSEKTVLETRYSGFYGRDDVDPLIGSPSRDPRFYDLDTGEISGASQHWHRGDIWRTSISAKLSHFADDFLGAGHDFKFGVQYYPGGWESVESYNDYVYTYSSYGAPHGYGSTRLPFHYGAEMRSVGFYADDSVRLGSRLTLSAGLRYDKSRALFQPYPILDANGEDTGVRSPGNDRLFTWNSLSPRIGLVMKVTADGKTVLRGHYGRYHRGIVTGEFIQAAPSLSPVWNGTWDFTTNAFDPQTLVLADPARREIAPAFEGSYTDQFLFGIERELFKDFVVAANGTHKRGAAYGAWSDVGGHYEDAVFVDNQGVDATGGLIRVRRLVGDPAERAFLLNNPEGMFTRFTGLGVTATKRMAKHWQLTSSLVIGSSKGRVGSSNRPTGTSQSGTANQFGQNPNDFVNTDGGLIGDRTTAFKTQLLIELPRGFLVAANYANQSGRPWARMARVPDLGLFTTILAEPLDGRRRLPSSNLLDLRLQKEFRLRGRLRIALFADVLNASNDGAYEWVESQLGTTANFGRPAGFIAPRRMVVGAKLVF